ncbi:MAG: DALR anticodon-binding domain-containing protein [Myxococcota bacterium]
MLSEDEGLSAARLGLALAVRNVLASGLDLLGVGAPERRMATPPRGRSARSGGRAAHDRATRDARGLGLRGGPGGSVCSRRSPSCWPGTCAATESRSCSRRRPSPSARQIRAGQGPPSRPISRPGPRSRRRLWHVRARSRPERRRAWSGS